MNQQPRIKFATDLVTFYGTRYWGGAGEMSDLEEVLVQNNWDPLRFWERMLSDVRAAGLDGIEITFAPGNWQSAMQAYGSATGFAQALRTHQLELCSGYLSNRIPGTTRYADISDRSDHAVMVEMADQYAEFLATCGADTMVISLPLRTSLLADTPRFVDAKCAENIADALNRIGYATRKRGVKLALHPEAFSMFRNSRDVDLFMLYTDPSYVFLCPDTAQFVVAGSNPIDIVSRHRERVTITHWMDATGPAPLDIPIDESIYDTQVQWFAAVGTGVVDWPAWMRLLRDMQYTGWAIFELDAATDPVADLRQIMAYVKQALLPIYR